MDLQLLGPIEATADGRRVPLGATKQRAVLAMLALACNRTVSMDRLIEGLWGADAPESAPKMVQLYVSQLRRLLAGRGVQIVTHGRGYELRVSSAAVDVERFERLTLAGAPREALALWRGDALADVADEPFAASEVRRLHELRLRATELAIDDDLAAGRHAAVIAELEALVAAHPLQERLHAQRMLALYRSGRQAEALEAYRRARRVLVEEIGVEPGPELRRLHDAVLAQEPALELPAAATAPGPATGSHSQGKAAPAGASMAAWRRVLAVTAALVLVGGLTAFVVGGATGPQPLVRIDENAVGVIDPDTVRITTQFPVGRNPSALTAGGGSVWVASEQDGTVSRLGREREPIVTIPVGDHPGGLAFAAGSLWIADRQEHNVSQVNPATNRVEQQFDVGNAPGAIAAGFGALWVVSEVDRTVARIDLAHTAAPDEIVLGANPTAIAAGAGAVWVTSEEAATLFRVEPRSGVVEKPIGVGNGPVGVAVGEGAVWVVNRQDATVSRIDPRTDAVTDVVPVGRDPGAIVAGAGGVWVTSSSDATVTRIDPATRRPAQMMKIKSSPSAVAVANGSVWTATVAAPTSHRGGTLRVELPSFYFKRLEAGGYADGAAMQVLSLAYDGLVAYRRAGGATFGTLVGDLAVAVPDPSPDGKSYVFKLRTGLRYSDGRPVLPEDVRTSLEDVVRRFGALHLYDRIVGVPKCQANKREPCDLSEGVATDNATRTVTIHLTEPDSEILHKLAYQFADVVPAGHPFGGAVPPPGTGPYRIVNFDHARGARLVRNPRFRVWSRDARPDGFADEIVIRARDEIDTQIAAVHRGVSDVVVVEDGFGQPLAPARFPALKRRSAGQLYTDATPELDFMFLNVRTPPFDDVRVRRAINYAVDRRRLADLSGAPDLAEPACEFLPPSVENYVPSCRYTLDPGPAGDWSGPDLDRARRLISQSGTRGMTVTVWGYTDKLAIGRYFVSLLRRLGYRSTLRNFPEYSRYHEKVGLARTRAQIGYDGWKSDLGTPSNFTPLFTCATFLPRSIDTGNLAEFCDRGFENRVDAALAARGPEASARWKDVYRYLADEAPAVPLANTRTVALVSKRAGNYQHHPLGLLLDQMWVR